MTFPKELDLFSKKTFLKNEHDEPFIQGMRCLIGLASFEGLDSLLCTYHQVHADTLDLGYEGNSLVYPFLSQELSPSENERRPSNLDLKHLLVLEDREQDHIDLWENRKKVSKMSQKTNQFFQKTALFIPFPLKGVFPLFSKLRYDKKKASQTLHWIPKLHRLKENPLFLRSIHHLDKPKREGPFKRKRTKRRKKEPLFYSKEPIPQISFFIPLPLLQTEEKDSKKVKRLKRPKKVLRKDFEKEE